MVNGRIAQELPARELAADTALQERLLGVRSNGDEEEAAQPEASTAPVRVFTVRRAHAESDASSLPPPVRTVRGINRWNAGTDEITDRVLEPGAPLTATLSPEGRGSEDKDSLPRSRERTGAREESAEIFTFPVAATTARAAYVAGTFDTKGRELNYLKQCLERRGLRVVTVDLSTSGKPSSASVHPREVARHHPQGEAAVFSGDRGNSVTAMALAFERFVLTRRDLSGLIGAGGSGGTTLATQGMRALPVGLPKVMVSTMASGDTRGYVGPSDICMMYSITDVSGINRISERVLANAAHALAGMMAHAATLPASTSKPAIGLTMFGVTTPCVQAVTRMLADDHDCLVFHATGVGGQSMEKLADSGLLQGVIDVSTTEVADEIVGGVLSAGPTRMDVFARHALPYVGSCGALDMVNWGAWDTVPERFRSRRLYKHNASVTLMRTTADECRAIGEFIARKLNAMQGPVRFLIPEGGVSQIDRPGQPFHDPEADRALFTAIETNFRAGPDRQLKRLPLHINDEAFAQALVAAWREVAAPRQHARSALA
ncbi:Tm-1-like ATP-binding domain-containing protein [Ramlibacter ginsenosidimutans]|uniref:UPF0261 protein JJB11_06195 n=1 Tax=Ramlibacter ginsenosidimutans TaxID=502333 RepID=A0A934TQV6_9BURK|nr:Tm-1-like ATP-binding domain-containing protein [Ramlibacter ginsenosidimutans]